MIYDFSKPLLSSNNRELVENDPNIAQIVLKDVNDIITSFKTTDIRTELFKVAMESFFLKTVENSLTVMRWTVGKILLFHIIDKSQSKDIQSISLIGRLKVKLNNDESSVELDNNEVKLLRAKIVQSELTDNFKFQILEVIGIE
jgi:hypothetical protein